METQAATGRSEPARQRSIDSERYRRALTDDMSAAFVAPQLADVTHGDEIYRVDLVSGAGECPDYQYRGDRLVCKHAQRACLAVLFDDTQRNTELVARVAAYAREARCPFENDCGGPCAPGRYPCPGRVRAVGGDDWAVWCALIRDTGDER